MRVGAARTSRRRMYIVVTHPHESDLAPLFEACLPRTAPGISPPDPRQELQEQPPPRGATSVRRFRQEVPSRGVWTRVRLIVHSESPRKAGGEAQSSGADLAPGTPPRTATPAGASRSGRSWVSIPARGAAAALRPRKPVPGTSRSHGLMRCSPIGGRGLDTAYTPANPEEALVPAVRPCRRRAGGGTQGEPSPAPGIRALTLGSMGTAPRSTPGQRADVHGLCLSPLSPDSSWLRSRQRSWHGYLASAFARSQSPVKRACALSLSKAPPHREEPPFSCVVGFLRDRVAQHR